MDSLNYTLEDTSEEPDTRIPNVNGKAGGNLQCRELEALRQRLKQEL